MIGTRYKYALIDMSYILMRNMFAVSKGRKIGEFTAGDLIRVSIQTINKLPRDFGITADKFIFVYDKWDTELGGYYRTSLLKGDYKTTREYITQEIVDKLKADPSSTKEEIEKAELKLYTNQVRYEAKYGMIKDLKYIGLPCLGVEGWEYDDLAYLAACMLYGQNDGKPSVLITKDSDLQYALTPQMEYFKIPTGGSAPRVITYNEMYESMPQEIRDCGMSLFKYKAYMDSLGEGHNDMLKTKKRGYNVTKAIIEMDQHNNFDCLATGKDEIFRKQMQSFDIASFPRLEEAKQIISNQFSTEGRLGSLMDFYNFCNKYKVTGISDKYYSDFVNRFDPKLFIE